MGFSQIIHYVCYNILCLGNMNKEPEKTDNDFYDDLPQQVKDSIEIGLKEIEAGEVYEHNWVIQNVKDKFGLSSDK